MALRPLKQDLSIFNKLELERPPVGINYEFFKPEGVEQLDKSLSLRNGQGGATKGKALLYVEG